MQNPQVNAVNEEDGRSNSDGGTCALDGCDNPLTPPAVDANGRRKGGRPSSYCCKAHADAASRARRNTQAAEIVDPLVELRRLAEAFTPAAQPVLDTLREMQERLDAAEHGALAQVNQAHDAATTAQAEQETAQRHAEQAEHGRDQALAQARDEQNARSEAQKQASRATAEAERVQQQAWENVAEHERARGTAEAARDSSVRERDAAWAELRETRDQLTQVREREHAAAAELEETRQRLRELNSECELAHERRDTAQERARAAEQAQTRADASAEHARTEADTARAELATLREETDRNRAELAEEHTARQLAESRAQAAESALEEYRSQLTAAHARLDQLLDRLTEPEHSDESSQGSGAKGDG